MSQLVFLGLTVLLLAAGQVAQKVVANHLNEQGKSHSLPAIVCTYQFWIASVVMALALLTWLLTLTTADVGKTYPMLASSFVVTAFASRAILREKIGRTRWLGIFFITLGAAIMLGWA